MSSLSGPIIILHFLNLVGLKPTFFHSPNIPTLPCLIGQIDLFILNNLLPPSPLLLKYSFAWCLHKHLVASTKLFLKNLLEGSPHRHPLL